MSTLDAQATDGPWAQGQTEKMFTHSQNSLSFGNLLVKPTMLLRTFAKYLYYETFLVDLYFFT